MKEVYSNKKDCNDLYKILKEKMGNKIMYYPTLDPVLIGRYCYHNPQVDNYGRIYGEGVDFCYKFCKDGFLRFEVGDFNSRVIDDHDISVGEKLAVLSNFYEVLSKKFGKPTVFYTTKDDDEGVLSLQWSFANKEEDIQKFKDDTVFDDAQIDKLVVIGEPNQEADAYQLDRTRQELFSQQFGLPYELLPLVEENRDDFIKYKRKSKKVKALLSDSLYFLETQKVSVENETPSIKALK